MYQKVKKSFENPYGIIELEKNSNPFNKPCLLGIFPSETRKEVNGYLSKFIDLLGLRHDLKFNCGHDISQVPFSLLTMKKKDQIDEKILQLIPERDIVAAKSVIRNLNIVSFCNGHYDTLSLINSLKRGLEIKGYYENEIEEILSQMFVVQIVDNLIDGDYYVKFPYVTSLTFHNLQDDENLWYKDNKKNLFLNNDFSRIISIPNMKNNSIVLYDSFGEGSLQDDIREHSFTTDYFQSPVFNTLMSVCLINGLYSSTLKEEINIEYLMQDFDEVLSIAHEYEKNSKELDKFNKEDLQQFNEYMMNFVIQYIKIKFKLNNPDERIVSLDNERLEIIKQFLKENKYSFLEQIIELTSKTNKIIDYYQNYDKNEMQGLRIGNDEISLSVEKIIKLELNELLSKLKKIILELNELKLSPDVSVELRLELEKYKTNIVKNLLNPMIIDIIKEYNVDIISKDLEIESNKKR